MSGDAQRPTIRAFSFGFHGYNRDHYTQNLCSGHWSRVENRRSDCSLPVAADKAFASSPQSGLAWLCFLFPLIEPRQGGFPASGSRKRHTMLRVTPSTASEHNSGVAGLIVNPQVLRCFLRPSLTKAPSLHQRYPASSVLTDLSATPHGPA